MIIIITKLTDWVNVLHPTWHKMGHFRDALPSQSPGYLLVCCCCCSYYYYYYYYYYYVCLMALFRTIWVSRHHRVNHSGFYQSKRWWGGSGISWTICKSFAPHSRQITTPLPHHSVFTGRMPFLPLNQQRQSTEGNSWLVLRKQWSQTRRNNHQIYNKPSLTEHI